MKESDKVKNFLIKLGNDSGFNNEFKKSPEKLLIEYGLEPDNLPDV